jgi:3-phosphoshikimate 1-carboxyvinyltransferase
LELGESGTLARLATAAGALCGRAGASLEFRAGGSLLRRTSPALFAALRAAGVRITFAARENAWPLKLHPIGPPSRLEIHAPQSSQEVSALLLAAAAWPDEIEVAVHGAIPSRPYLEMTRRLLERLGVAIEARARDGGEDFLVRGPLRAGEQPLEIEPDASASAVLLAAACLSGGEISIAGLSADSLQGDVRIAEHLAAFGCRAGFDERGIFAGGLPSCGARLDLSGEPDLAPVLAAVAACAALRHGARTQLAGLGTLQGKESARISVLGEGLAALGLHVIATDTTLEVSPGRATAHALLLDPRGDHRMVFAFALLGLVRDEVDVSEPDCVSKSWPKFWTDLAAAGASVAQDGE